MKRHTNDPKRTTADAGVHDHPNGPDDCQSLVEAPYPARRGRAPSGSTEGVSCGDNHAYRHNLNPALVPVGELFPLGRDARKHANPQIAKIANSLREYGFVLPVLITPIWRGILPE